MRAQPHGRAASLKSEISAESAPRQDLFTGDNIWFGAGGGYSSNSALAEDDKLTVKSRAALEARPQSRKLHPLFLTGNTRRLDFPWEMGKNEERMTYDGRDAPCRG